MGCGSFGSVYKIRSKETQLLYAAKGFVKETAYSSENGKESLMNEIEVLRTFDHVNLMKFHGVYETKNSLYIVV